MSEAVSNAISAVPRKSNSLGRDVWHGILSGQVAGLIMAIVMMVVFFLFLGKGPLYPVQVIGSVVWGDAALQRFHVGAFIVGLLLHQFGPPLVWGSAFGVGVHLLDARRGARLIAIAVTVGFASQIVDVNLILPRVMIALHGHDIWAEQVPAIWSWAAHLVFGLGLLVLPKIAARLGDHTPE